MPTTDIRQRMDTLRALLLPYQRRWVEDKSRFLCGVWARQTGKSFSTAFSIAASMVASSHTAWMIAAPSERQSLESLQKVKDWLRAFKIQFEDSIPEVAHPDAHAASISLPNSSRCIAVPGKPDTVRGMSANIWLDEFAFFEQPDSTWRAILPSITNPLRGGEKRFIITSTPNGRAGAGKRFYDIVHSSQNSASPSTMHWSIHRVTLPTAIEDGLPVDYQCLADALDDPTAVAQELNCEFLDSTQTLLPYDLIALAESFTAQETAPSELFHSGRELYCGIDFGRTTDPTVCWTLERLPAAAGDLLITREVLVLRNTPTDAQEAILATRIYGSRRTCFDYTGPGIGLGDYLARLFGRYNPTAHTFGRIELCTFSAKFKRDIFPRLRRAFEPPTRLRIPPSQEIRDDLHAIDQIIHNGEYTYAAPHTAAGHSDRATALALAVRAAGDTPNLVHAYPCPRPPFTAGWSARQAQSNSSTSSTTLHHSIISNILQL